MTTSPTHTGTPFESPHPGTHPTRATAQMAGQVPLTPTQRATLDELLNINGPRPQAPAEIADQLREHLDRGISASVARWTEPNLWLSKSMIIDSLGCEEKFVEQRRERRPLGMIPAVAVGVISHRAIQLSYTHPNVPVEQAVREAVRGARNADSKFLAYWDSVDISTQSDLLVAAISRTTNYLDSWPPLAPDWSPRFEEPMTARFGKLALNGRVDLALGRPRPDGKQTMVIADWKSGNLRDSHELEADFYALVSTLRHGVPPYRSFIYSLASGDWTTPDVTRERLFAAADMVVSAAAAYVETMTNARTPLRVVSGACSWCPLAATCSDYQQSLETAASLPLPEPSSTVQPPAA